MRQRRTNREYAEGSGDRSPGRVRSQADRVSGTRTYVGKGPVAVRSLMYSRNIRKASDARA